MRGNISFIFQDSMGLQWTVEFCDQPLAEFDEESWRELRELRHRIAGPEIAQRDGKRIESEPNPQRSAGHVGSWPISGAKSPLGIPFGFGKESLGNGGVPETIRSVPRDEDHQTCDTVSGIETMEDRPRKRSRGRPRKFLRKSTHEQRSDLGELHGHTDSGGPPDTDGGKQGSD